MIPEGIVMPSREEHAWNMLVGRYVIEKPSSKVTDASRVQAQKTLSPMAVTVLGIVTLTRSVSSIKACSPIVVRLPAGAKVTDVSAVHPLKAAEPIVLTFAPITMDSRFLL